MKLSEVIVLTANSALKLQNKAGGMPSGHNGPYHHKCTPARNTAHWTVAFLKAYDITKDNKYQDAAFRCCEYLIGKEARPFGYNFLMKESPHETNGLIGDAWVIEALSIASKALSIKKYRDVAREVFLMHPFNSEQGVWQILNTDGSVEDLVERYDPINELTIKIPETFNHILWFALSGLILSENCDAAIDLQLDGFFSKLPYFFESYEDGLVSHNPYAKGKTQQIDLTVKHKEIGYHAFNLYAYAIIKKIKPDLELFKTDKFNRALQYITSTDYCNGLLNTGNENNDKWTPPNLQNLGHNRYGFAYNVSGFEAAYILWAFQDFFKKNPSFDLDSELERWTSEQIRRCFDFKTGLMTLNTEDEMTLAARIYEATRLPDIELTNC
jgi:hypothetical protein